ncbi:PP2C family protein-serine/threonine phosphatase [Amycolatopsis jiangsuensis]|uniref:Serine phosphatase RsbU (Regulator of sigma subunit) n=1 Tax=Amycolatopsis jiangsuensis TaxID=1181879 RepID=A0A840J732_9PSEU|nr:GAF domain-containing SpoIIE family protein phosphatase [Amycolatopsis jiangsuensis]MBB4689519.1 serine phosphatase RsbU (regulator of sigma subunit) [Amycolatopsis jiangsuensis]
MPQRTPEPESRTLLSEIISTGTTHVGLAEELEKTLDRACAVLEVDTATVLRHEARWQHLVAVASAGLEEEVYQGTRVPVGSGFAGAVAQSREPVVIDRVDETTVVNALLWERGLHTMLGVPMLAGDELVGVLHVGSVRERAFSATDIETVRLLAGHLAAAMQAELLRQNQSATLALQRSLLPGSLPRIDGLRLAGRYVPGAGAGLGGDWYDLFELPGDRVGIVMGDVSGHGLDAAVIMGRLRSALRAYALDCADPAEVLGKLNRKADHFEHGVMATVAYGIIDAGRSRLALSLAGHLPPALVSPGTAAELVDAPADPPIGLTTRPAQRRTTVVGLRPDTVLAFYTDGLVERRDQLADTGMRLLTELLRVEEPEPACTRLMSKLVGSRPPQDDVALVVIRVAGTR